MPESDRAWVAMNSRRHTSPRPLRHRCWICMLHPHRHGLLTSTVTTSKGAVETLMAIRRRCTRRRKLDALSLSRCCLDGRTGQIRTVSCIATSSKSRVARGPRSARPRRSRAECPTLHRGPCLHARLRRTTVDKRRARTGFRSKAPAEATAPRSFVTGSGRSRHRHRLLSELRKHQTTCLNGATGVSSTFLQRATSTMKLAIVRPDLPEAKPPVPLPARAPAGKAMLSRCHPSPAC